jgi:hypothetical protein
LFAKVSLNAFRAESVNRLMLTSSSYFSLLLRFLDAIVQDNFFVRRQDYTAAFNSAVTGNENNTQIVFDYIKRNLADVSNA